MTDDIREVAKQAAREAVARAIADAEECAEQIQSFYYGGRARPHVICDFRVGVIESAVRGDEVWDTADPDAVEPELRRRRAEVVADAAILAALDAVEPLIVGRCAEVARSHVTGLEGRSTADILRHAHALAGSLEAQKIERAILALAPKEGEAT